VPVRTKPSLNPIASAVAPTIDGSSLKRETIRTNPPSKKARTNKHSKPASAQRTLTEFLKGDGRSTGGSVEPMVTPAESPRIDLVDSLIDHSQYLADLAAFEAERDAVKSNVSKQWTSIFTPKNAPLCDTHGLPCIELVTKKQGPNLGRKFWICSKPVGPGYDNGKRAWSCLSMV
jgi:AP endonuclease-2